MTGRALVVQGDALHLPLPDASVDLVVTSPPYFALRAYDASAGQLGSEATPQAYLEALWAATAEMARVLKPTGSIFCDLGDKYAERGGPERDAGADGGQVVYRAARPRRKGEAETGFRQKSLMLLPERYRIGCVDHLGLTARAVIVWDKPNGLPESVQDRVRRSHEDWVHLTKQPRYYSAVDEVREPHAEYRASKDSRNQSVGYGSASGVRNHEGAHEQSRHPLGKLPGSVWSIPSEPLRLPAWLGVDHYAAFPSEWPRRLILGWSPPGICVGCGQGRVLVVDKQVTSSQRTTENRSSMSRGTADIRGTNRKDLEVIPRTYEATILGYACACTPYTDGVVEVVPEPPDFWNQKPDGAVTVWSKPVREYHLTGWQAPPTRPGVVLDPFSGTGTTIGVAKQLGRIGIGVDLSHAYCRAARYRVFQSGDFGKAEARTWAERQGTLA